MAIRKIIEQSRVFEISFEKVETVTVSRTVEEKVVSLSRNVPDERVPDQPAIDEDTANERTEIALSEPMDMPDDSWRQR